MSITWHSSPAFNEEVIASIQSDNNNGWIHLDVTDAVKQFIQNPASNYGFMLKNPEGGDTQILCRSSEYEVIDQRPKITIIYGDSSAIVNEFPNTEILSPETKQFRLLQQGNTLMMYLPWKGLSTIAVFGMMGKQVASFQTYAAQTWYSIPLSLSSGKYLFIVNSPETKIKKSIIIVQ